MKRTISATVNAAGRCEPGYFNVIMISSVDTFMFSKPLTVKYLTRTALSLIVIITVIDFIVSLIKNSDKAPIEK